jgi:hypothetical protein
MTTLRFILALAELLGSPIMLLWYAWPARRATIRGHSHQPLDFSVRLG